MAVPYLCNQCSRYLRRNTAEEELEKESSTSGEAEKLCQVCLGLWGADCHPEQTALQAAIDNACLPYGGRSNNKFATLINHAPTLSIAGEIYLRYQAIASQLKQEEGQAMDPRPYSVFLQDLKSHIYKNVNKCLSAEPSAQSDPNNVPKEDTDGPQVLSNSEQQGYLSIHILSIPPKDVKMSYATENQPTKKRKRQKHRPFTTQGGDPRANLDTRLKSKGHQWLSLAEAQQLPATSQGSEGIPSVDSPMEFHVAVFRKPIFLYGYYTKSRRDVSQTPFVIDGKTLGVTSVEEQICEPIVKLLGISEENNPPPPPPSAGGGGRGGGKVMYGMCKFHASGREDMDVRMLLRPGLTQGRPFCIQLVDSLRPIESQEQLDNIVATINCQNQPEKEQGGAAELKNDEETHTSDVVMDDQKKVDAVVDDQKSLSSPLWYGQNPLGVGISKSFELVPAHKFSGLQADTEEKVKHYGCYCWLEQELPMDWKLPDSLSLLQDKTSAANSPLIIRQKTPLRVLHRRANLIRERQILAASAKRIDAHHFRLELSTQAGTYIKEFVHGDLQRTIPNMATLLGTKTNILLLDCEGIDVTSD